MNSGGSPSGDSAPPILPTRKMKNTTTWTLLKRSALARSSGRIRIIAAPVVPTTLAITVPKARIAVLTSGVPRSDADHQDAARDHVEREQNGDEAEIIAKQRMDQCGKCRVGAVERRHRRQRQCRPDESEFAVVVVPKRFEQQRSKSNRQQDPDERQSPDPMQRRAIEGCGVRGARDEDQDRGKKPVCRT